MEDITRYIIGQLCMKMTLSWCTDKENIILVCSEKMELERKLGQSSTRVEAMVSEKKVMEANIASLEETQRNLK